MASGSQNMTTDKARQAFYLEAPHENGFTTDQYGNFVFKSINPDSNLHFDNNDRTIRLRYYWDSGNLWVQGKVGIGYSSATTENTYALSVNGDVSATTFYGALSGNATTATSARYLQSSDTRSSNPEPSTFSSGNGVSFDFKTGSVIGLTTANYSGVMTYRPYASGSDWSGGNAHQLAFNNAGLYWRQGGTSWGNWTQLVTNSGTWGINITGNATSASALKNLYAGNTRPTDANLAHVNDGGVQHFKSTSSMTSNSPGSDGSILHFHWDNTGAWDAQLHIPDASSGSMHWRGSSADGIWGNWYTLLDSNNYTSYTVTKTGSGASGTWGISITGNAATATTWATARNFIIGNKTQSVKGDADVTWTLNDILYNATTIGTATSWDQTGPSVYYVASSSAFTGTNHPGNNSEQAPYTYGQLIVSRAGTGGILQIYAPHTGSAGNVNSGLRYRTGWNNAGWQAWSTLLDDRLWRKYIFANKNIGRSSLTVTDSSWAVTSGTDVFGLSFKDTGLTYTPSGGSATASSDTGDWRAWLTCAAASNTVTLNMRIDGTWQASKFIGPLQGNADTATTWQTARTLTIGATGKSVNGSDNVSWSMNEIMGSSDSSKFYRGDKTWSNTLDGTFTANGTITANGGYLKSTVNSNTVTIGSQNINWCHFMNSANISFYFNNAIHADGGFTVYNTNSYLRSTSFRVAGTGQFDDTITGMATTTNTDSNATGAVLLCPGVTSYTGIYNGNGDGPGTDGIANIIIKSWWGVGFVDGGTNKGLTVGIDCRNGNISASGSITGNKVYNAVWNDYAECRQVDTIQPGYCVTEQSNGIMTKTTQRLMPGCKLTSDTFGTCMGETTTAKTPIAVAGRVLVYTYRNCNEYPLGAAVCSAPGGTVDIMTRDEIIQYPERIVGTVSEIPDYAIWHAGNGKTDVVVNGRIWVYVR